MFNISPMELMLVCVVALLVIGPDKLPGAIRTGSLWLGRFRRSYNKVKSEIERELNTDEIKRQLHNEAVLEDIEEAKAHVKRIADETQLSVDRLVTSSNFDPGASSATESQTVRDLENSASGESGESGEAGKTGEKGEAASSAPGMSSTRQTQDITQADNAGASSSEDPNSAAVPSSEASGSEDTAAASPKPKRSAPSYGTGINPKLAKTSAAAVQADAAQSEGTAVSDAGSASEPEPKSR